MEYEYIKHVKGTSIKIFSVSIVHRMFHFHSDIELLLVAEGSVIVNTGQQQYVLWKDDFFLTNKNEVHSLTATDEPNSLLVLQFDANLCKAYYPKMSKIRFVDKKISAREQLEYWEKVKQCFDGIVQSYLKKQDGFLLEMMGHINMLLFNMITYSGYTEVEEKELATENRNMERLHRILDYIQQNYMLKTTLKKIAEEENLDMCYLSHFIKKHLGMSFQDYLNKLRIYKAAELLARTDMRNIDICMECGFSDYKYLRNTFIKEFHCTPGEYKKTYRSKAFLKKESGEDETLYD